MSSTTAEPITDATPATAEAEVKPSEPVAEAQATAAESSNEPTEETANEPAAAPSARRSSRISSQPHKEPAKPKKAPAPKNQKKRTADEAQEEGEGAEKNGTSSKKTKTVVPDIPSIDIGDPLPTLTLKNEKDEDVDVSKLAAEKGVVIFLVPKADTPGCTTQACGFRDVYAEFSGVGYDVYCLSADTTTAQSKWQTKKNLSYSLLSDPKRVFIAALGAADKNKTKRSHFIFEKGTGKLVDKKNPVKPADSPTLAIEFIKQHHGLPTTEENGDSTKMETDAAPQDANGHADAPAPEKDDVPATEKPEAEPTPMET
ncbi:thioredoxin peroxidase dot5 [Marasmius tenuissimus]|uniref:thioredoxin-dependent peroxiredoxin n=1 Tax=Marasmius tenuissimus TaxID=585030 RepID=A0ABR3ACA4_9AGAR|nr:thioredoxin peroxidase dot5 [Marasmius tenuissimus]